MRHIDQQTLKEKLIYKIKNIQKTLLSKIPTKQQLFAVFHLIINQHRLVYSHGDLIISAIRCLCLRKNRNLLKGGSHGEKKEYYIRKGADKLVRDLDIVNLIDLIKGYRVM